MNLRLILSEHEETNYIYLLLRVSNNSQLEMLKAQSDAIKEPENKNIIGAVMRKLKSLDSVDVLGWSFLALSAGFTVMLFMDAKRSAEAHRRFLDRIVAIIKDVNNEFQSSHK